ncbi:hypothetical protein D3C85_1694190 [compost metagenome]
MNAGTEDEAEIVVGLVDVNIFTLEPHLTSYLDADKVACSAQTCARDRREAVPSFCGRLAYAHRLPAVDESLEMACGDVKQHRISVERLGNYFEGRLRWLARSFE